MTSFLSFSWLAMFLIFIAAWLTHVVICIKTASWLFLIAGGIFAPIAVVHGIGVWFSVW